MAATNGSQKIVVSNLARDSNGKYVPERALELIPEVSPILHQFLSGEMKEADAAVKGGDPKAETLYYSLGQTLIEAFKAFMSFEHEDLGQAIDLAKHSAQISNAHRKHASGVSRFTSLVQSGSGWIKSMSDMQRHAELCYQESILIKAIVGIMYSGDWFGFVKEALNLRSANIAYRNMAEYIHIADKAAGGKDTKIDEDFRSGVLFGEGVNSLVLSMLPSKVISFVQIFGFEGDRKHALDTLYAIGGWDNGNPVDPDVGPDAEGVRRPISDIALLIFHLLLSNYTYRGIDLKMAGKIVEWSYKRYPSGVFYLFAEGRINELQSRPDVAKEYFVKMIESCQVEFKSLHNISLWELCICNMALYDMPSAVKSWRELLANANWSKCAYTYALACCLYREGGEQNTAEAKKLFAEVPGLMQRIAGRSIPLEKYAARKAKKFTSQGDRLLLPQMELGYHFLCITRSPRDVIVNKMWTDVEAAVKDVESRKKDSKGYWDDYLLTQFLTGVCLRYMVYPNDDAVPSALKDENKIPENAAQKAVEALETVIDNATKIETDHWMAYYAHYELGLLYAAMDDMTQSRKHLDTVLSGKVQIKKSEKGKYSMESNLLMRTHAAMEHLDMV